MAIEHSPILAITATPSAPRVDRGDVVRIDIFIHGAGHVADHSLVVHAPPQLLSDGLHVQSFSFASNPSWQHAKPVLPPTKSHQGHRFAITFNKHYFESGPNGQLHSELVIYDGDKVHPPLAVEFDVSNHAPAGEHELRFILRYSGTDTSHIAETTAKLSVRSFAERHQNFFTAALTVLTFAAPFALGGLGEPWNLIAGGVVGSALLFLLLLFVRK